MYPTKIAAQQVPRIQPSPLYAQLVKVFQANIRRKVWAIGAALPSEGDLARQFGVSVGTARKALEILEQAGWVVRRQGRGTYVSNPAGSQAKYLVRVVMQQEAVEVFESCALSLLEEGVRNSTEEEADILKLKPGAGVVRVRRLYRKGSSGVMMEEIIMRGEEFGDFDRNLASAPDPLALILAESATEIGRCVESISAVPAPERVAKALGAADGTPMLHCRRLLEDDEGKPLGALDRWILADTAVCTMVLN